jgi:rubrerythrin
MTKEELINGIRVDIQKEQDAINTYMSQVHATSNSRAKKVLKSIADEERVHVGELTKLLELLNDEEKYLEKGEGEVIETLNLPKERERKVHCKGRHHKGHQPKQNYVTRGVMNLSGIR